MPITLNIITLLYRTVSFGDVTNVSMFLLLIILVFYFYWLTLPKKPVLINFQYYVTKGYINLIKEVSQSKSLSKNFVMIYIMTIFLFIVFGNITGLIINGYTITAIIVIPFILSILAFTIPNFAAVKKFNFTFLSFFKPSGISWTMNPMLINIELISHSMRVVSLAVRLFANMFAGHVLLYILCSTIAIAIGNPFIFMLGALVLELVYFIIYSLEWFIALLQAYVFNALVGIYITETLGH